MITSNKSLEIGTNKTPMTSNREQTNRYVRRKLLVVVFISFLFKMTSYEFLRKINHYIFENRKPPLKLAMAKFFICIENSPT